MKVQKYTFPHSSFMAMEKDMGIIIDYILKNENLKKLLYYPTKDYDIRPNLTQEESISLFGSHIRLIPHLPVDPDIKSYLIISFDNFIENANNPEFRDNTIEFDILCHYNQWNLKDFKLRPYQIAAELDTMLNKQHLTGIGTLNFLGANEIVLNNEYAGICLIYSAIHGEEDRKNTANPANEKAMIDNFNAIFNED